MISRFLVDSFHVLLAQGKSPLEIRQQLLLGGYQPDDIDTLLSQQKSLSPPPIQPTSARPPLPVLGLSILLILESVNLFARILTTTYTFSLVIKSITRNNGIVDIFQTHPFLAFTPIIYALLGIFCLLSGFCLLKLSPQARRFGLLTSLFTLLLLPLTQYLASISSHTSALPPFSPQLFFTPEIYILAIMFLILAFSSSRFDNNFPRSLDFLLKLVLAFICLILLGIATFVTINALQIKNASDTDISQLSSQVKHRIYQLSYLPFNLSRSTKYFPIDKPLLPDTPTIRSIYDSPTHPPSDSLLIFDQSTTPLEFDLTQFISTLSIQPNYHSEKISLENRHITNAYYLSSQDTSSLNTQFLYFTSIDSTLFLLTATGNFPKEELLNIATGIIPI